MKMGNLAALVTVAAVGSLSQAQNLLVNPSFEDPKVDASFGYAGAYTAGATIGSGWVVESADFGAFVIADYYTTGEGVIFAAPTDGGQFLYVGNNATSSTITQDVVLQGSTQHVLTFDLAEFLPGPYNSNGAFLLVDVRLNGSSILGGVVPFTRPARSGYEKQTLTFTTQDAGEYRLWLRSGSGYGTNVDNFSLTAVPAPGAAMAIGAMALTVGVRRRRSVVR
jgi:hypothetical protein